MSVVSATMCLFFFCVFGCSDIVTASDMYTSSAQVQKLLDSERSLLVFLEKLFTSYSQQNSVYKRTLSSVQSDLHALPVTSSAGHPLEAVIGLHRYLGYVERYLKILPRDIVIKVEESLHKVGLTLPSNNTLAGSQNGLLRLQSTYKLTSRSLVTSLNVNVSAEECVAMATLAEKAGLRKLAVDWFDVSENLSDIQNKKMDMKNKISSPEDCNIGEQCDTDDKKWTRGEEFEQLCAKHISKNTLGYTSRSSSCRYHAGRVPLRRWKSEELSHDPPVVLYHDVISNWEAEIFVKLGASMLERATTGESPVKGSLHEARTSKVAWLWDNHTETVERVSQRVADITGLHTEFRDVASFGEPFQVVNYGIGGHYSPHYDFYVNQENVKKAKGFSKNSGDRMATFMFYLSDVEGGGATVFPDLGIGAPPVKNAALFWYNFRPDGSPDPRTRHGGCPVLYGHKWVANKWIRQISGAMTMTCHTKPSPG